MKTNEQLTKELNLRAAKKLMMMKETFNRMLNDQPVNIKLGQEVTPEAAKLETKKGETQAKKEKENP